jgi:hypothetical protein
MNWSEPIRWGGPAALLGGALWRAGAAPAWVPLALLVENAASFYEAYSLALFLVEPLVCPRLQKVAGEYQGPGPGTDGLVIVGAWLNEHVVASGHLWGARRDTGPLNGECLLSSG